MASSTVQADTNRMSVPQEGERLHVEEKTTERTSPIITGHGAQKVSRGVSRCKEIILVSLAFCMDIEITRRILPITQNVR